MFLFSNLIVEIIIALIAIIAVSLLWIVLIKSGKQQVVKTRDASLTCEELEEHARKTAVEHFVDSRKNMIKWPIPRMNDNYNVIFSVYKSFNEEVRKKHTIPPAAEWLLDNFYILEEQVKIIKNDLKKSEYALLPVLKCGELKGYARVQAVAMDLIAHTDGQMDENIIYNYLKAYQSHSTLLDREIWSLPVIIRIALIENIRSICEKIRDTQVQWNKADEIIDNWLENEGADADKIIKTVNNKFKAIDEIYPSFIEHLSYRLRREKKGYTQILKFIDDNLARFGTQLEDIMQKEHNSQAVSAVSMGNCILSIKYISTFEWTEIFESTSQVEQTLRNDPVGIYPLMDFASRNYYRSSIAKLSSKLDISELHIAREAVEQAKEATDQAGEIKHEAADIRISHVGYYLVGKGLGSLVKKLTENKKTLRMADSCSVKYSKTLYIGAIIFFTLLLSATAAYYAYRTASICRILLAVIAVLAVILPISEIVTSALNWLICSIHKPYTFPRLELKKGIPEDMLTVIVIPALLPDEKRVKELLENLERHYLANKDDNLYYALVGDFKDADVSRLDSDETIVQAALNGIAELNSRYPGNNRDVFYYFHRQRKFNESHKRWMGWERKRGALIEFNNLLLGSKETGFAYYSGTALLDVRVKYVITLDADTILPIGMAKKMIGTMAHPLNRPVIDFKRGIVVEGYGLMQPKVSYDIESSNKSLFSRIFTGQEGIDPYPNAVSDIYQDLFCEGIYTGKGIYDLKVFQTVLENAIPDDRVLSHDLLEGSYIRTGLATDLELVDSYPSRYNSYFARIHRWVRGDWQLLPWLFGKVLDRNGILINNPLTFISKWKIFDNMRRSLIAPSALILVLLSFLILPGSSLVWAGISVLNIIFPLVLATSNCLFSRHVSSGRIKRYIPVISGLKAIMLQVVLMLIFLPYQAYLMDHAITVTLIRVLFTKKNMLEWVTAADVEKGQKNSLKSYWSKMWFAGFTGVLTAVFAIAFKPAWIVLALFFMVIWIISPNIAYFISKTYPVKTFRLTEENSDELKRIARKTWRYFEEFADFRNHYLAPDNYQEDPPRGIAYRTSPTNIGLGLMAILSARDLGYIGTSEMLDLINNTINTIEKLEKWNGHLYNWYDTRTLRPLRPRYVSTVDSGNMVCYLITLVQGMKEYLDQPLIDSRFIDGIKITLKLVGKEGTEVCRDAGYLMNIGMDSEINVTEWNEIIDQLLDENKIFNTRRSPWKAKAYHMLKMFKKEISDFMPWHELLNSLPEDDSAPENENINEIVQNIKEELMAPVPIKDFKSVYENVLGIIAKGIETIKSMNGRNPNSTLNWLEGLQSKVSEALEFSIGFIGRYNELTERIRTLSEVVKFEPLFMEKKQMFSIGFNIEEGRLTNSFYDLLASESRQTSYIAIARGEVPAKHWFKLGRALTVVDYYKGLISWTGTMFEYLMPLLLMKSYKNTLLDETYSFVIRSQKKYGKQRNVPWGASESCFYSLDINLDYQYKAIGVPWLGLKRGLIEDAVAAPYATFLALMVDPEESIANIKALKAQGAEGPYGFYEAVDYTPGRIPFGAKRAVIKCFMAHHEGMSLLSLNNFLNDFILQKRFHSDPVVKSAQLLLQEKVPANIVYTKEAKEKVAPFKDIVYKEKGPVRKFRLPDPILPKAHILSNGNYSVMVTDRGTGFSKSKTAAITRWRDDSTLDNYGMFFYIRNTGTNSVWSACYAPINVTPDKYEVTYLSDKARFRRLDGDVETQTEIVVTSGDNAEIRRITLKNYGQVSYTIEVTSYFEVVIASQAADIAHPAFSNLFVRTEFLPETGTIIAHRRPRTEIEKSLWIANTVVVEGDVVGDLQYETDRAQFIGRGHNLSSPAVILHNKPLSNTTGPVLDPIISQRIRVKIEPGKSARLSFITIASETSETLTEL
ncbi:MAG: glucoamylase family protein, partial [Bacillota bacterium]|nr:glucoamylase family protein [Bacillota bacterium]